MRKRMRRPSEKVQGLVEVFSPACRRTGSCGMALELTVAWRIGTLGAGGRARAVDGVLAAQHSKVHCLARSMRFSRNENDDATPRQWTSDGASGYRALEFLAVATVKTFKGQQGRPSRNKQVPLRRAAVLRGADVYERQPERDASDE